MTFMFIFRIITDNKFNYLLSKGNKHGKYIFNFTLISLPQAYHHQKNKSMIIHLIKKYLLRFLE